MRKNIILIILSIMVIILGGYITSKELIIKKNEKNNIDKNSVLPNINCPVCSDCKKLEDQAKVFYENLRKNRKLTIDYDYGFEIVLDKEGNVYISTNKKIEGYNLSKNEYAIEGYVTEFGSDNNILNGYKLDIKDVISMYHVFSGNGGYQKYIFIKGDGTIGELTYYLYTDSEKNSVLQIIEFKNLVPDYKNIVSVVTSNDLDAHGYKLIDIDGNIY